MDDSAILEKTSGTTGAYIRISLSSISSGTPQTSIENTVGTSIAVPSSVIVAEAESIIEDAFIRAHYTIVPKKTITDLVRIYEARIARQPSQKYVDIDLPIEDDDGGNW